MSEDKKKLIGHISVDSGLVWVGDPCYAMREVGKKNSGMVYEEVIHKLRNYFINEFPDGTGICISTPNGDGTYPVYAIISDKEIPKQIIIDFEGE